jgi:hypothetical protein
MFNSLTRMATNNTHLDFFWPKLYFSNLLLTNCKWCKCRKTIILNYLLNEIGLSGLLNVH